MKRLAIPLLVPLAMLVGCAGTPGPQVAKLDAGMQCEREQPTGSKLLMMRCRTLAERQLDQRDVDALTEATRRQRVDKRLQGS
ncbi:hypothetical protein [Roseateles asaccharophilus]|uniref:Lipoprotein n=1 Tax=Roseateles asaccharophilus TaxID=582607 RepID=A0ABU2A8V7_9BURK|nr:hypothetical protein [Roseateles asaccharophilus]MDR7333634.1 hypothetical protein [Roseateles asaccharophilus]